MGPSPTYHQPKGQECESSVEHGLPLWAKPAVGYCSREPRPSPMRGSRFVGARAVGPWVGEQKPLGKTPLRGSPHPESTYLPTLFFVGAAVFVGVFCGGLLCSFVCCALCVVHGCTGVGRPMLLYCLSRCLSLSIVSTAVGGVSVPCRRYDTENAQALYTVSPLQAQQHAGRCPHNYRRWRHCLLLLYIACFFHTPTAPNTGVPSHYYHALVLSNSVISPHNTRYNNKWVLECGDVDPNPGHRRIHQLERDCRLVPGHPIPLLDIEEYTQHLVVNTNRQYNSLDNATNTQDRHTKLATWNIQGAQGSGTLQLWASVLHFVKQYCINLCGIQKHCRM